jgi:hypothetical protein
MINSMRNLKQRKFLKEVHHQVFMSTLVLIVVVLSIRIIYLFLKGQSPASELIAFFMGIVGLINMKYK